MLFGLLKTKSSSVRRTQLTSQLLNCPIQFVKVVNFQQDIIQTVLFFSSLSKFQMHSHSCAWQILHITCYSSTYTSYFYYPFYSSFFLILGRPGCPFFGFVVVGIFGGLISPCLFFICVYKAAYDPQAFPHDSTVQKNYLGIYSFFLLCIFGWFLIAFDFLFTQFDQFILIIMKPKFKLNLFNALVINYKLIMKKQSFNNQLYEGDKGKLMLQLSKSFKGDSRFRLDDRFKDDIDVEKLPQKFKQIAEKGVIEKINKNKKIKKDKPLMIQRFEPGTVAGQIIVKKAEGKKKYQQGLRRHQQKLKKKGLIQKGINKLKKAEMKLKQVNETKKGQIQQNYQNPKFKITVNGNRKEAFKQTEFKLFG